MKEAEKIFSFLMNLQEDNPKSKFIYTEEQLQNISELCDVLRTIRARLIREGISIEEVRNEIAKKRGDDTI